MSKLKCSHCNIHISDPLAGKPCPSVTASGQEHSFGIGITDPEAMREALRILGMSVTAALLWAAGLVVILGITAFFVTNGLIRWLS